MNTVADQHLLIITVVAKCNYRLRPDGSGVWNLHRDVLFYFCHQLLKSLTGEWSSAEHSLVQDDPDTPEIRLGVIKVREEDLRGHVEGGAPQASLLLILLQVMGKSKVSNLEDGRTGTWSNWMFDWRSFLKRLDL